jgi:hypothetical protein
LPDGTGLSTAKKLYEILQEYDSVSTLQAVVCDNTHSNTGHLHGAVAELERLLQRKVHKIGCLLHWNELPFRKVIQDLDGPSLSGNKWGGPIGQQMNEDIYLQDPVEYKPISSPDLSERPDDDVINALNSDQRILLEYVLAIDSGVIHGNYIKTKPGPPCQARWLTLATRILILYTRTKEPTENMIRIVEYIQKVYAPGWFLVKTRNDFLEGPKILHRLLIAAKSLNDEQLLEIFKDKLQCWAFPLMAENFLAAMLFAHNHRDRMLAGLRINELKAMGKPAEPAKD